MRFHVHNFGCRATQADGAALEEQIRAQGGVSVAQAHDADLVVVNTCTVTATADREARQYVRRLHRRNPRGRIVVTGCYAQRAPRELASLPGVTCVVGNSHKAEIPALVAPEPTVVPSNLVPLESLATPRGEAAGRERSLRHGPAKIVTGDIFAQKTVLVAPTFGSGADRTRPTLKIQDGCNNRCSYCVIPFVRGRSRSLPSREVIRQVHRLVGEGYQEVVLSGVDLGSYGQDCRPRTHLLDLVGRILRETGVPLLRLSSLEPMDLSEEFLRLIASTRRVARHIHAPMQSGSDRILRRMRRWYTATEYAERIQRACRVLDNVGIGADVLVGFPGETENDFRQTYEWVERLPFTYLHVFGFSPRPGTAAARFSEQVPPNVVRERSRVLRSLATQKAQCFRRSQVGRRLRALTLGATFADGTREALSENYLKLRLRAAAPLRANQLVNAQIETDAGGRLLGVV